MTQAKLPITILQLYPKDMNIYGDTGNVQVIAKRLEWYGYKPNIIEYNVGDTLPKDVDIILGGGGQDSGQEKIHTDLLAIGSQLQKWADQGKPMLMVCGLYQLFGKSFTTLENIRLEGIGIFDAETYGTNERLIGNIITTSEAFGDIMGYENHSGQTFLGEGAEPFAAVIKGAGNNMKDGNEGARYKNVIGTYLHGALLPKNPAIADFLIETAVTKRYKEFSPDIIDDTFATKAREIARERPR